MYNILQVNKTILSLKPIINNHNYHDDITPNISRCLYDQIRTDLKIIIPLYKDEIQSYMINNRFQIASTYNIDSCSCINDIRVCDYSKVNSLSTCFRIKHNTEICIIITIEKTNLILQASTSIKIKQHNICDTYRYKLYIFT